MNTIDLVTVKLKDVTTFNWTNSLSINGRRTHINAVGSNCEFSTLAYLKYVIINYDKLSDYTIFVNDEISKKYINNVTSIQNVINYLYTNNTPSILMSDTIIEYTEKLAVESYETLFGHSPGKNIRIPNSNNYILSKKLLHKIPLTELKRIYSTVDEELDDKIRKIFNVGFYHMLLRVNIQTNEPILADYTDAEISKLIPKNSINLDDCIKSFNPKGKIGIGIVTFKREDFFSKLHNSIANYHSDLFIAFTGDTYSREYTCKKFKQFSSPAPVGHGKTWLLEQMMEADYEHIFILEDDICIKDDTVFDRYVDAAYRTKMFHLLFGYHGPNNKNASGQPSPRKIRSINGVDIAFNRHCVGALEYFHKSVIERVGYYDVTYNNSLEHVDHTYSIIKAGFIPAFWWFPDIANSCDYITDLDPVCKNTSIKKDLDSQYSSYLHFKTKYGMYPNDIPDTPENVVFERCGLTRIVIKFPTRNRPAKFMEVFEKYQSMLSGKHDVRFIVSMDDNDTKMNTDEIRTFLNKYNNVKYFYGNSSTKIEAINADLNALGDFDILLLASDDMIPQCKNYDDIVVRALLQNFPDTDGVLGFRDGNRRDDLITFTIMGKKYFDRFGYIYNPSYTSVFCDNEFTDVAKITGKVKYYDLVLFKHGHANYVGWDELMLRNENKETYKKDNAVYIQRRNRNFDLPI